ncbi:DUF1349 domain-containing protein [Candidatus Sumerlaeota bacterium]|nr:DUF1349 domain-containing protein [Candidatus Sumerlaeota bacterium]
MPAHSAFAQWLSTDIGDVGIPGSDQQNNGTFIVRGSGENIWNKRDEFRYVYQELNGDVMVTARILAMQNTDEWAKAGVMIRETLAHNAKYINCYLSPHGICFHMRTGAGDKARAASETLTPLTAPCWVRLVREGDIFTGYCSRDGEQWTKIGSVELGMAGKITAGLMVCSLDDSVICEAQFDHVSVAQNWSSEADRGLSGPQPLKIDPVTRVEFAGLGHDAKNSAVVPCPSKKLFVFYRPGDVKSNVFTLELENSELAEKFPELKIDWIDVDQNSSLVKQYSIFIVPTAVVQMADGSKESFVCSCVKGDEFLKWLGKHFDSVELD